MEMKISHIRRIESKDKTIVIGKVYYKSKVYNVTYNSTTDNVIICEWYTLSKEEIEEMAKFVKNEVAAEVSK